jgi:photosystem II stability/assembly factor-like uncharacterized protein
MIIIKVGTLINDLDISQSVSNPVRNLTRTTNDLIRRFTMSMKSIFVKIFIVALLAVLINAQAQPVLAGYSVWTSHGPPGGYINILTTDPANSNILYAGTAGGGLFKSANNGDTWYNCGLAGEHVFAVVIDPHNPNTLYAGVFGSGVYKSSNGGDTWTNIGLSSVSVYALIMDPENANMLYAGTFLGIGSGDVFKSTDNGQTWDSTGLNKSIYTLAIDPDGRLYAGTSFYGVFKSDDGGDTWVPKNSGLTEDDIIVLEIDPSNPSILYAGGEDGLFKSDDGGETWNATALNLETSSLAIDPSDSSILYAGTADDGVWKSEDSGDTWDSSGLSEHNYIDALAIKPSDPGEIFAGTWGKGIFRSENGGDTWIAVNTGLNNTIVHALVIHPTKSSTLYAGTDYGGVFKSTDIGSSWSPTGLTDTDIRALAIDPSNPLTIYAGTYSGVLKSTNSGESWSQTDLTGILVPALAIDPDGIIYAGNWGGGVVRSTNTGNTWDATGLSTGMITTLAIDPHEPNTIYAGSTNGIFKTTNAGTDWPAFNTGLTNTNVYALAIDPQDSSTIYAGTGSGVFKIISGGVWTSSGLTSNIVHSLAIDPHTPSTLYAGTERDGVFRSEDGGNTWSPFNTGLTNLLVYALAIDPHNPDLLFAGTAYGGVFRMTIDQALDAPTINSPDNTTFMVGSPGTFTVTTSGYPTPTLSSSGSLPDGVTFNDIGDGTATLAGTPGAGTPGDYVIEITASNGVLPNATQTFTLTVVSAPTAPAITSGNNTTFMVGSPGTFTVTTTGYPTPTLSQTGGLPSGVTFTDDGHGTATLAGSPAAGIAGEYVIEITASNGVLPNATQTFTLTVVSAPTAPAITSGNNTTFMVGSPGTFTVTTTGYPTPTLSQTGGLPSGVTFTDDGHGTATLAGSPAAGTAGEYVIEITASNGVLPDATQTFTLKIQQPGESFSIFLPLILR